MPVSVSIGVLVDRGELLRSVSGRPTRERIALYRRIAVEELRIKLIVFSFEGIDLARNRVRGYTPSRIITPDAPGERDPSPSKAKSLLIMQRGQRQTEPPTVAYSGALVLLW